jgi:hypothetical protein
MKKVDPEILLDLHIFTPSPNHEKVVSHMLFAGTDEDLTTT